MNPMIDLDMGEVTRLTRAGRLTDAMAMLRGRPRGGRDTQSAADKPASATPSHPASSLIDMVPPAGPGGAWTVPHATPTGFAKGTGSPQPAMPDPLRAFVGRLGKLGPASAIRRQPGSARGGEAAAPPAGARFEWHSFGSEIGAREYKLYEPSGYRDEPLPLMVLLHGCTQSPDDFAAGTRMNELAEEQGFLVAYPAQTTAANASKCWNWFSAGDQRRDRGEPALIAGITRRISDDFAVDPQKIYVAGLSAGGAAAAIMGSVYPDLYAAVGVHSGLACGAASDMPSAFAAMRQGAPLRARGRDGRTGDLRPVPTIVFHGDRDSTVNPVNGDQVIAQSRAGANLHKTTTRGAAPGGTTFTRTVQANADGRAILEQWILHGAGHAWSGGSPAGSYTDPRGPDASREMLRFFAQHVGGAGVSR